MVASVSETDVEEEEEGEDDVEAETVVETDVEKEAERLERSNCRSWWSMMVDDSDKIRIRLTPIYTLWKNLLSPTNLSSNKYIQKTHIYSFF
jgi:hypothetical protein